MILSVITIINLVYVIVGVICYLSPYLSIHGSSQRNRIIFHTINFQQQNFWVKKIFFKNFDFLKLSYRNNIFLFNFVSRVHAQFSTLLPMLVIRLSFNLCNLISGKSYFIFEINLILFNTQTVTCQQKKPQKIQIRDKIKKKSTCNPIPRKKLWYILVF